MRLFRAPDAHAALLFPAPPHRRPDGAGDQRPAGRQRLLHLRAAIPHRAGADPDLQPGSDERHPLEADHDRPGAASGPLPGDGADVLPRAQPLPLHPGLLRRHQQPRPGEPHRDPRGQVVRAGRTPNRGLRPAQPRIPGAQPPLHPRAGPVPAAVADHRLVRAGAQPAVRRQGGHRRIAFDRGLRRLQRLPDSPDPPYQLQRLGHRPPAARPRGDPPHRRRSCRRSRKSPRPPSAPSRAARAPPPRRRRWREPSTGRGSTSPTTACRC